MWVRVSTWGLASRWHGAELLWGNYPSRLLALGVVSASMLARVSKWALASRLEPDW